MSNIPILDGTGGTAYLKANGTGTDIDPFVQTQNQQGTVSVAAGTVTASQAGAWNVGGTVSVSNLPASQIISGTVNVANLPASQPITGTVSVAAGTVSYGGTITWSPFYSKFATSGDGTPIPAVAGSSIWIQELDVIAGQTINNNLVIKYGTVTAREVPLATRMEGAVWSYNYPDYIKLPVNTALVTNLEASGTVSIFGRYAYQPG